MLFYPIILIRTFIQRACSKVPGTGKHVNHNNQLEEELAHTHFKYTENKHEKTNYEFTVRLLLVYELKIIPVAVLNTRLL